MLALLLAAASAAAPAQTSFTASLMSDYRYRGVSLSGELPAVSVSANHDFASGLYGGVSVASARLRYTPVKARLVSYAGFARRMDNGYGWDVGVADVRYRGASRYDYQELYAGLTSERLGARVSVSPHYLGIGPRSVYTQVTGSWPLGDKVDLFADAGYLHIDQPRKDARIGISVMFQSWTVQLAWSATRQRARYSAQVQQAERQLVLSTTVSF